MMYSSLTIFFILRAMRFFHKYKAKICEKVHSNRSLSFFGEWLRAPTRVGAISPSSQYLAKAMVEAAALADNHGIIIELGGGTGAVTQAIINAGISYDRLYVIEYDQNLADILRKRFPQLQVIQGNAAYLSEIMSKHSVTKVDAIISSLPLLNMPPSLQLDIFTSAWQLLGNSGRFTQFTYGPGSPLHLSVMTALHLKKYRYTRIWRNLPPACIWYYEQNNANVESGIKLKLLRGINEN